MTLFCYAQNPAQRNFYYSYEIKKVDSTYDAKVDPSLNSYVASQKAKLDRKMNVVIGYCDQTMNSFVPQSPLSNFLVDLLLKEGPNKVLPHIDKPCDFSILNFGGIRSQLPAGEVTIGNIYAISPFDNFLVLVDIKGSELRKALMRFTEKKNAALSGVQMIYRNGRPIAINVNGEKLDDNRIYRLITLNFIAEGGDRLLTDVHFEKIITSNVIFRSFLIDEIANMTKKNISIKATLDDRVVIKPTM